MNLVRREDRCSIIIFLILTSWTKNPLFLTADSMTDLTPLPKEVGKKKTLSTRVENFACSTQVRFNTSALPVATVCYADNASHQSITCTTTWRISRRIASFSGGNSRNGTWCWKAKKTCSIFWTNNSRAIKPKYSNLESNIKTKLEEKLTNLSSYYKNNSSSSAPASLSSPPTAKSTSHKKQKRSSSNRRKSKKW